MCFLLVLLECALVDALLALAKPLRVIGMQRRVGRSLPMHKALKQQQQQPAWALTDLLHEIFFFFFNTNTFSLFTHHEQQIRQQGRQDHR